MNTKLILDFLSGLRDNNNREWMHANKADYLKAKHEFAELLRQLIREVSVFDSAISHLEPESIIYRLNRDTRFSKDKRPYNPYFTAHLSPGGKVHIPVGYFVYIAPGGSLLGGGLYTPALPKATSMIRDAIAAHSDEFMRIVTEKSFAEQFSINGEKLKNVPKGYDAASPVAEYLKHKSWDIACAISDEQLEDETTIVTAMAEICRAMKPFNDFFNRALDGFVMPSR